MLHENCQRIATASQTLLEGSLKVYAAVAMRKSTLSPPNIGVTAATIAVVMNSKRPHYRVRLSWGKTLLTCASQLGSRSVRCKHTATARVNVSVSACAIRKVMNLESLWLDSAGGHISLVPVLEYLGVGDWCQLARCHENELFNFIKSGLGFWGFGDLCVCVRIRQYSVFILLYVSSHYYITI